MLHWIYIALAVYCAGLLIAELFTAKRWREQIAVALVLVPLVLRILQVK